jgi:hypothetical protein
MTVTYPQSQIEQTFARLLVTAQPHCRRIAVDGEPVSGL